MANARNREKLPVSVKVIGHPAAEPAFLMLMVARFLALGIRAVVAPTRVEPCLSFDLGVDIIKLPSSLKRGLVEVAK
jgi:hypothetical protein